MGLPPLMLVVGGNEMLLGDNLNFVSRAHRAGAPVQLCVLPCPNTRMTCMRACVRVIARVQCMHACITRWEGREREAKCAGDDGFFEKAPPLLDRMSRARVCAQASKRAQARVCRVRQRMVPVSSDSQK